MTNKHYPESLLVDYKLLLNYWPSHITCRPFVVKAIQDWKINNSKDDIKILEIGPGFGEMTEMILKSVSANMTLVEADKNALDDLSAKFESFKDKLTMINADATVWIKDQPNESFDIFTASWVIHNFTVAEREVFLKEVARILKPGGLFIIFDKVLPDDKTELETYWQASLDRLSDLDRLGKTDLKNEMIEHEKRDMDPTMAWYEKDILEDMKGINLRESKILFRDERDVVFSAIK